MLEFRFNNDTNAQNIDGTAKVLMRPRLWVPGGDYPEYRDWFEKTLGQLETEEKRAMVAWWGGQPVGSVVYQRHPQHENWLEIKNISVEDAARGRKVASFLVEQAEHEGRVDFPGVSAVVLDTKVTNLAMIGFTVKNGYTPLEVTILESQFGHNGVHDVVLAKDLPPI